MNSRFTGAARELADALLVNPFATQELAEAIHAALTMPPEERSHRMRRLRVSVAENNVYRWAGKILSTVSRLEGVEPESSPESSPVLPSGTFDRSSQVIGAAS